MTAATIAKRSGVLSPRWRALFSPLDVLLGLPTADELASLRRGLAELSDGLEALRLGIASQREMLRELAALQGDAVREAA